MSDLHTKEIAMGLTSKEVMKIARERAGFNYSKSANAVLLKMVSGTHRGKNSVPDISVLRMRTKIVTVMKWAAVTSVRQAARILSELTDSGVLRIAERRRCEILYTIDPQPLLSMETSVNTVKATVEGRNKDRASKARERYTEIRNAQRAETAERYLPEEWW
jgi:hypothetical protein